MVEFKELKGKIQMELILDYHNAVMYCETEKDLVEVVKIYINKAVELILPDHIVILKPQKDP